MIDSRIVDWIKSEESQGYSEKQLKQYLLKQGYNLSDINEAIKLSMTNSNLSFNQFLSQLGTLFTILFYIFLSIFTIPLIIHLIISLIKQKFVYATFEAPTLILIFLLLKKRNLYGALFITFLQFPLMLLIIPLVQSFTISEDIIVYIIFSSLSIIFGFIVAYMFFKVSTNFKKYIASGILFSSILAIVFSLHSMIGNILDMLSQQLSQLSTESLGTLSNIKINSGISNPSIAFILSILFFNIPFFIYYFKREDKNLKLLLLYLIPIVLYIILSLIFNFIANKVYAG